MKLKIKKGDDGASIVTDEKGMPMRCPWVPAIPMQSKLGGLQLLAQTCDTRCPFLEVLPNAVAFHCVRSGAPVDGYARDLSTPLPLNPN